MRDNNNAWFTVPRYNLYPDLNLEEPEEQEEKGNSQCPLQNLLAEKLLQAAAEHSTNKAANNDGNTNP